MTLNEINFDGDDRNLFLVDDLILKAEAIKHSILPKLQLITNETIARIEKIYITPVLDLSTIVKYPSFRKTRISDLKTDYTSAEAGLGAKRDKFLWEAVLNKSGKQPMILPFSISYRLDEEGLFFYFRTNRFNLQLSNYDMFYKFHLKYAEKIYSLCNGAKVFLQKYEDEDEYKFSSLYPLKHYLKWQIENGFWNLLFFSRVIKYPISSDEIEDLIEDFSTFYPIYENYLKLAAGQKERFKEDFEFLDTWKLFGDLDQAEPDSEQKKIDINNQKPIEPNLIDLKKLAETKMRVMPALRWLVFSRDNWKCVSCGKSSIDGKILHVDHIIPRSKGGPNHLDNYQTLCSECNIGKSNRDQTNLRDRNI